MTPKERAVAALTLQIPDEVPTFELEYQITQEKFGRDFIKKEDLIGKTAKEIDKLLHWNAEFRLEVFEKLGYSIIPIHYLSEEHTMETARIIRKMSGDKYMLTVHGDGTFAIPDGNDMYEFSYRIADDPDAVKEEAQRKANAAIERNHRYAEAGIDSLILCDDYCYNSGPYLSPAMFEEYIQPYLAQIIKCARSDGQYTIKHTDGNIMPILNHLVDCEPHALHSIDPMAGVDLGEVKKLVGSKVCLCGNVNCALLQTGTPEEIRNDAIRSITTGKPGGGYIYCTSNTPFKGMPVDSYDIVLDVWNEYKKY